jgi:putative Ca2+/H+ antiporter (TMEM165/GDT1 family)
MLEAFLVSVGAVFVAELGDKSQLMALTFAARYRAWIVLVGVTAATLLVHAGSVILGVAVAAAIPANVIQIAGGVAFFGFAAWTLRGDSLDEDEASRATRSGGWAVLAVGSAFFLAELGDKTMLVTITLATNGDPWGTWLGSTVGMVAADAIAIAIGSLLGTRLPERTIKIFASAMFIVFGVLLVAEGLGLRILP